MDIRVRYGETDQMGYVYYGNYASYYEAARVESIRHLGLSYKEMEEAGTLLPVLENYSKFIKPATYDEVLKIEVRVESKPTAKIRFDYSIHNEKGDLIHTGHTVLVFTSKETGGPCRPDKNLIEAFEPYFS